MVVPLASAATAPARRDVPALEVPPSASIDGDPVWLDEDERATWLGMLRIISRLPPLLDARLEQAVGLNLFEYTILAMLSEEPDLTLRMSRLASVTNASPSKLSHAARHLEARGYLVREPDPDDGRCIRALLTVAGRALVVDAAPSHVATVRSLVIDALTPQQLQALRQVNELILARVDPDGTTDPRSYSTALDSVVTSAAGTAPAEPG